MAVEWGEGRAGPRSKQTGLRLGRLTGQERILVFGSEVVGDLRVIIFRRVPIRRVMLTPPVAPFLIGA
jgi:hypothetical protein